MRVVDVVVAVSLLLLLAPVAVLAAVAIVCESRGGVFYRSKRVGLGGKPFIMWKLRTMRRTAGLPVTWADDPRVTVVGHFLRRTHLDEYPQLWNVIRGDMALVGPRPEDRSFVDLDDPRWQRVLTRRPGITGPTQLTWAQRERQLLRGRSTLEMYRRDILPFKLASDLRYVDERTNLGDVLILLQSLIVPFRRAA